MDTIESLADISDQTDKVHFLNGRPQRIVIAKSAAGPQPLSLICSDEGLGSVGEIARWRRWHGMARQEASPIFDLGVYCVKDVTISGCGNVWLNGRLVVSKDIMMAYARSRLAMLNLPIEMALPLRVVEDPCVSWVGWGTNIYGHLIVEMLPRLLMVRHTLGAVLPHHRYLVDEQFPQWFRTIISNTLRLAEHEIEYFDSSKERILLKQGIIATQVMDNYIHPFAMQFYDQFASMVAPNRGGGQLEKIFITRAFLGKGNLRGNFCTNEVEIAQIAATEFGFSVIAPETLPLSEQSRVFANTSFVAGVYGSGLHTAIFSQPGTRVGAVGPVNSLQSTIAIAREQRMIYMGMEPGASPYVDLDKFRFFLERLSCPDKEKNHYRYILKSNASTYDHDLEMLQRFNCAPVMETEGALIPTENLSNLSANLLVHRSFISDSVTGPTMTCMSVGANKTIEGFAVLLNNTTEDSLVYQSMSPEGEWSEWITTPGFTGTSGLAQPLAGFAIQLKGELANKYTCRYAGIFGEDNKMIVCDEGQRCADNDREPMHAMQITFLKRENR